VGYGYHIDLLVLQFDEKDKNHTKWVKLLRGEQHQIIAQDFNLGL